MISIVEYGASNLASVVKAFRAIGAAPRIARTPDDLAGARGIVIPGVGHFESTRAIDDAWRAGLRRAADTGTPLLGICLGMQWLYEGSDEAPGLDGFGAFSGRVFRLEGNIKVPHVGWNTLAPRASSALLNEVAPDTAVYFTHGFAAPTGPETIATTTHGAEFAAIVERDNIAGMQFHPEKSGAAGLTLLRNWVHRAL